MLHKILEWFKRPPPDPLEVLIDRLTALLSAVQYLPTAPFELADVDLTLRTQSVNELIHRTQLLKITVKEQKTIPRGWHMPSVTKGISLLDYLTVEEGWYSSPSIFETSKVLEDAIFILRTYKSMESSDLKNHYERKIQGFIKEYESLSDVLLSYRSAP